MANTSYGFFLKHFDQNSSWNFLEFFFEELYCHLFLPIEKSYKFQGRRCHQNSSKNQMTPELFHNFEKNNSGNLLWQIHQMTYEFFKNFNQNSGWKCSCSWLRNSYEFWLEFQLILINSAKSADCVWLQSQLLVM